MNRYGKRAPTEEARSSARQLRKEIMSLLEAAIDNNWNRVIEECDSVKTLARHCQTQENGYESVS